MDQQKRTKVLGGVLAGVLGFMAIRPDQVLLNPVRDAQRRLDIANSDFERADAKQTQLMIARERIERARATSLPPRVSDAQRLYQTWITNLAEQCRFAQLQVVPGRTDYRRDQFLTVNVDLEAETDLAGLSRFLYLFEQADLQHRIAELDIRSTGSQNNPRLEINLTAEGMSVARSPEHSEVFPRTVSPQAVTAAATELTVESIDGFPKETPFLVQLGREMVQVTAADEHKWTVIRGQEGTSAVEHAVGESVQLFPIPILKRGNSFDSYEQFLAGSPFTKPAPPKVFRPRLASISDKTIAPGESVSMTAKAEDFNPDVGTPVFALEAAAEGMSINAETGEIQWSTSADIAPGRYSGKVILTQKNNDELRVEKDFTVTVQLPNDAPSIEVPPEAVAVIGREFILTVAASDDGPTESLHYSLTGDNVPSGLAVDEKQGVLKWTPPRTFSPGEYKVNVTVTDSGEPAKSATGIVNLKVQDDTAAMTKFTGVVDRDGVPMAWFWNQAQNRKPELRVGQHIVEADINAEITEIDRRHVLMKDAAGVWRLNLGETLRQRQLIEPAMPSTDNTSPEAETSDTANSETSSAPTTPTSDAPATDAPATGASSSP